VSTAHFKLPLTAVSGDIDELGHVSNQVYLRWVLETAVAHSTAVGWSYREYLQIGGAFVVRRHELDYLAPVRLGEQLFATTWIESVRGASCVRATEITRNGHAVSRAATTWVFTSLASGRPQRIPVSLRESFAMPLISP